MTIAPTGAQVRWRDRVIRTITDDDDGPSDQFSVKVAATREVLQATDGEDFQALIVDLEISSMGIDTAVRLAVTVIFEFRGQDVSDGEMNKFLADSGVEYGLGFVRGALLDGLLQAGRPAALIPIMPREQIAKFARVSSPDSN